MSNTIFSYQAVQSKISPSPSPQFLTFLLFQVEELEKSLSRAQGASQQKQQQLDSLNQGIEKLKRKVRRIRLHRCPLVLVQLELEAQDKRFISIFMQAGSASDCPTSIDYCWCVDRFIFNESCFYICVSCALHIKYSLQMECTLNCNLCKSYSGPVIISANYIQSQMQGWTRNGFEGRIAKVQERQELRLAGNAQKTISCMYN